MYLTVEMFDHDTGHFSSSTLKIFLQRLHKKKKNLRTVFMPVLLLMVMVMDGLRNSISLLFFCIVTMVLFQLL